MAEILLALLILLIAILTMVGYTVTIHRAAKEGKHQALATVQARALLERVRDYPPMFMQANDPAGYTETRTEYLLDTETDTSKNEAGQRAAATFELEARANPITNDIYGLVVTARWDDDGRTRNVVLESRMKRPYR